MGWELRGNERREYNWNEKRIRSSSMIQYFWPPDSLLV